MAILRKQNKTDNFVILDKYYLQNKTLSYKAKGLLTYLLSLPDNWEPKVEELANHSTDGKSAIYSAINELKDASYITSTYERASDGKFSRHIYFVHEVPQKLQSETTSSSGTSDQQSPSLERSNTENKDRHKPHADFLHGENRGLISNNCNNNINKQNTAAIKIQKDTQGRQTKPAAANFSLDESVPTALTKSKHHDSILVSQTKPAAVVHDLSLVEKTIGKVLTQNQRQIVSQAAQALMPNYTPLTHQQLQQEIELTLICSHSYTKAGKDFFKKLNTIKKAIRENKFKAPVRYGNRKQTSSGTAHVGTDDLVNVLQDKIQRLSLGLQLEMRTLGSAMAEKYPAFKAATQQRIDEYTQQIGKLKGELSKIYGAQKHAV